MNFWHVFMTSMTTSVVGEAAIAFGLVSACLVATIGMRQCVRRFIEWRRRRNNEPLATLDAMATTADELAEEGRV